MESKFPYIADEVNKRLAPAATTPAPAVLYRVQCGAFTVRSNADRLEAQLKAKSYPTFKVQVDGFYKVQVGAFADKKNADKLAAELKAAGFDTYITTKSGVPVS